MTRPKRQPPTADWAPVLIPSPPRKRRALRWQADETVLGHCAAYDSYFTLGPDGVSPLDWVCLPVTGRPDVPADCPRARAVEGCARCGFCSFAGRGTGSLSVIARLCDLLTRKGLTVSRVGRTVTVRQEGVEIYSGYPRSRLLRKHAPVPFVPWAVRWLHEQS